MTRGFLSEGGSRERQSDDDITVDLELGWATEKAFGFRSPFRKDKSAPLTGGSKEKLVWIPKAIRGEPLEWTGGERGPGKLRGPRWLLEKNGLV